MRLQKCSNGKIIPDWYAVELENGANEVTIWADAEAYLHRAVVEDYSGNDIPQTILTFVTQNYKQALLTEVGKWSDGAYQRICWTATKLNKSISIAR